MKTRNDKVPLKSKRENLYVILLILALFAIAIAKDNCKAKEFSDLRNEELTIYTEGVIHDISSSKYGSTRYWYNYTVDGKVIGSRFQTEKVEGLNIGSRIKVAYLRDDPYTSRIVFE